MKLAMSMCCFGAFLFLPGCHKRFVDFPTPSLWIDVVLSSVQNAQQECFQDKGRYCSFREISIPPTYAFGSVEIVGDREAVFEYYNIKLYIGEDRYCVGAIPVRQIAELANITSAEYRDSRGKKFYVKYPWSEVPEGCQAAK